jgi:hypothetical protein
MKSAWLLNRLLITTALLVVFLLQRVVKHLMDLVPTVAVEAGLLEQVLLTELVFVIESQRV